MTVFNIKITKMYKLFSLILFVFIILSCTKENKDVKVTLKDMKALAKGSRR